VKLPFRGTVSMPTKLSRLPKFNLIFLETKIFTSPKNIEASLLGLYEEMSMLLFKVKTGGASDNTCSSGNYCQSALLRHKLLCQCRIKQRSVTSECGKTYFLIVNPKMRFYCLFPFYCRAQGRRHKEVTLS
jgi:hypothetical protein